MPFLVAVEGLSAGSSPYSDISITKCCHFQRAIQDALLLSKYCRADRLSHCRPAIYGAITVSHVLLTMLVLISGSVIY